MHTRLIFCRRLGDRFKLRNATFILPYGFLCLAHIRYLFPPFPSCTFTSSLCVQHRGGKLLTPDEREQIEKQIKPLRAEMEKPINLSYERFRHNLRSRPHPRLSQTSEVELRGLFRTSQQRLESLQSDQTKSLSRAQARLKNQDEHRLEWQHVFGDIPKSDELIKLIDEWLDRPENKKAAALAKVSSPSEEQQAYA